MESHHDKEAYETSRVLNLPTWLPRDWKSGAAFRCPSTSSRPERLPKRTWHGVSVLPRARGVLETLLRKLAPAVLWVMNKWSGQPDLHRHPLNSVQESFSWTMTANERRGL